MHESIVTYNNQQSKEDLEICVALATTIENQLPEAEGKIWHGHPVWFLEGNPVVGYSLQKAGWRLMFWSGADFGEEKLNVVGGKFKDASIFYHSADEINLVDLQKWLEKARDIQWDYKNLTKRKGKLEKLK